MCCLFGIHDYGHNLSRKQMNKIISVLSTACEVRGTDATGIAYNCNGHMSIYKRPFPAHLMRFRIPNDVNVVMGHTRLTTQGDQKFNFNNHPFRGVIGNQDFALAHNGVIYNDLKMQRRYHLPYTRIGTDSYVAVQMIEREGELSFESLRDVAETLEGSFTFTLLSDKNDLYFIKGDNPMCIYHFPGYGIYMYASTEEILQKALSRIPYSFGKYDSIQLDCGEILRIDADGKCSMSYFNDIKLLYKFYDPWWWRETNCTEESSEDPYLEELKSIAAYCGISSSDIDQLILEGFTYEEIEEMVYG